MRNLLILSLVTAFLFGCGNQNKEANESQSAQNTNKVYSVDELYDNAADLVGQEVAIKGTVMHVCQQGGGRCFLMGSSEDIIIRVEAGENIGAFSQEQMGSVLTVTGIFKEVKTEEDAHNPAIEHSSGDHNENEDTESAHRIILESEDSVQVVYFVEGLKIIDES
jgi:hypothetical protein